MERRASPKIEAEARNVLNAIRQIVKSLRQASKSTEKDLGLSFAQLFVLQNIANNKHPLSINELANKTFTHQSSVSVVVGKLAEQKLVLRTRSKEDARSLQVAITKKGEALLSAAPPLMQDQLLNGIFRLSSTERRGLVNGLNALLAKSNLKTSAASLFFEDDQEEAE